MKLDLQFIFVHAEDVDFPPEAIEDQTAEIRFEVAAVLEEDRGALGQVVQHFDQRSQAVVQQGPALHRVKAGDQEYVSVREQIGEIFV